MKTYGPLYHFSYDLASWWVSRIWTELGDVQQIERPGYGLRVVFNLLAITIGGVIPILVLGPTPVSPQVFLGVWVIGAVVHYAKGDRYGSSWSWFWRTLICLIHGVFLSLGLRLLGQIFFGF